MNKPVLCFFLLCQLIALRVRSQQTTDSAADGSKMVLKIATGNIYGTLTLPQIQKKVPVVLIIVGSGATDRNGNAPGLRSDMYRMLADSLLRHGIASLRYDKRGVGESTKAMPSESGLVFGDMIRDAEGWIELLKTDKRFSRVIVLGHSEGSLIGMVAARETHADGYISVSGAGERIDKIINAQLQARAPQLAEKAAVLLDSLTRGQYVQEPGGPLNALFRSSVQPYLISWCRYDPKEEIKKLHIPVLILQGTTDIQVSVAEARALKDAQPAATLVLIEGMSHVLKPAPADPQQNMATYNMPGLSLKPELISAIDGFILH